MPDKPCYCRPGDQCNGSVVAGWYCKIVRCVELERRNAELEAQLAQERRVRQTAERESMQHAERTAQLYIERDQAVSEWDALYALLNEAGGLVKLVAQVGGPAWVYPDGSTVTVSDIDDLLRRISEALSSRAAASPSEPVKAKGSDVDGVVGQ